MPTRPRLNPPYRTRGHRRPPAGPRDLADAFLETARSLADRSADVLDNEETQTRYVQVLLENAGLTRVGEVGHRAFP